MARALNENDLNQASGGAYTIVNQNQTDMKSRGGKWAKVGAIRQEIQDAKGNVIFTEDFVNDEVGISEWNRKCAKYRSDGFVVNQSKSKALE